MIYFLAGAALGFCLLWLVRKLKADIRAARFGISAAVRLALIVVVVVVAAMLAELTLLEAERNIRLILGGVFGALIAMLAVAKRRRSRPATRTAMPAPGFADGEQAVLSPDPVAKGPWWLSPSSLILLALIALPLWALVAPNGELDLSFVRSVKTPFMEAQFTKSEVKLSLKLQSEPQGFFLLGADGLGDALHMARNEVIFRKLPDEAKATALVASPAEALAFLAEVLQPLALCANEVDRLYGDQEFLFRALRIAGAGLTRAHAVSIKALQCKAPKPCPIEFPKSEAEIETRIVETLKASLKEVDDDIIKKARPVLKALADGTSSCARDFTDRLEGFLRPGQERQLTTIIRNPAVVHATSMFFLWSGNPRAVLKLLETAEAGAQALKANGDEKASKWLANYPALPFTRGFAKRWEDEGGDHAYLKQWDAAIQELRSRLDQLQRGATGIEACQKKQFDVAPLFDVISLTSEQLKKPLPAGDAFPDPCKAKPEICNDQLAYGYYAFLLQKYRNHLVYESARELMTRRSPQQQETTLIRALRHSEDAMKFVAADGLRRGHCFTQQRFTEQRAKSAPGGSAPTDVTTTNPDHVGGSDPTDVTTTNPDHVYAAAADSHGSLIVAKAFLFHDGDKKILETALDSFEQALAYAEKAGDSDSGSFVRTIHDHRSMGRAAIGLTTP